MDAFFPFALFFVVLFGGLIFHVFHIRGGRKVCPDCSEPLPPLQSPFTKTKRQWWEGGYVCQNCGCETDIAGSKVASGAALQRRSVVLSLCVLAIAIVPAVALNAFGLLAVHRHVAPALREAPASSASPILQATPESLPR